MTETQTPPPACAKCGDTGTIPPFMDACTCGAMPTKYAPESNYEEWNVPMEVRGLIPGTTIPTPGFPVAPYDGQTYRAANGAVYIFAGSTWTVVPTDFPADPKVGQIAWNKGKAYAWDGAEWQRFDTEALTYEQFHARYGKDAVVMPAADVEREADDAALFALRAAEMEAAADADAIDTELADGYKTPAEAWGWDKPEVAVTAPPATIAETVAAVVAAHPPTGTKMASAPQGALLARLIAERDPANILVQAAKSECTGPPMTAKRASQLIDALVKLPAVKAPVRANKYDGSCGKCTGNVPAGAGRIEKNSTTGRWITYHLTAADCITEAEKAVLEADRVDEPGLFRLYGSTDIYRVRHARGSKRLYGEKIVTTTRHNPDGTSYTDVRFVYNANAMRALRKSDKLTWAEARDFGKAYGACVACGRTLSDPRSLVQQYGPTCAGHYHWPTVTQKQAEAIIAGTVTWEEVTGALAVV